MWAFALQDHFESACMYAKKHKYEAYEYYGKRKSALFACRGVRVFPAKVCYKECTLALLYANGCFVLGIVYNCTIYESME